MDDQPKTMWEGKYLRLVTRGRWEYVERTNAGSAVIVIAVTPEDKLVFVEQFRVPMNARGTLYDPAALLASVKDKMGPAGPEDDDWWKGNIRLRK